MRRRRGESLRISSLLLSTLATLWPSPVRGRTESFGAEPGSLEYDHAYAVDQYQRKVRSGLGLPDPPTFWGRRVLELGCGHGGISCFLAGLGARQVMGVDLNHRHLRCAQRLKTRIERESDRPLPVSFQLMDGFSLAFADATFDVVLVDNVFEHLTDPTAALREIRRVLHSGGWLLIPIFSSIKSKYGLHLKHGLKVPWANLLFSEETIVDALRRQARRHPQLREIYPHLDTATTVAGVRRHGDLNNLTYGRFRALATEQGFRVCYFQTHATLAGKVMRRLFPRLERTILGDILSVGAAVVLTALPRQGEDSCGL